ncbi:3,4-dihydroxy-9,10-secoandrosta-1,3,5(10)-triene-9,17-dione 4,5-dioxygenase [Rhodospirillales bacterium URHD0017]|nr:3,4-dihydroxy-9,10-secoandrosta-1,3,5(10)-triene-9,17-dione 4,5-dioxygenase [Rhodospirillales bacterium URHD0017]
MLKLGYLAFAVRRPDRWQAFCRTMLGLPEPITNPDGSLGYALDGEVRQRLVVAEGKPDDLASIGLDCGDDAALDALLPRLAALGLATERAPASLGNARRVARLHLLSDPMGNRIELHTGAEAADRPFASTEMPGGYRTGALGMGHAVLVSRDLATMERFYVDALGFGVSERLMAKVGPIQVRGTFLHCNRRHHSLALFDLPLRKRLHHFMLQAERLADVGAAFERARRTKVPLSLELGQHPDPDGTFSFYGRTPSGFDFEIGAGGQEIDPVDWCEHTTDVTSVWGHKPKLGLQLRMAKELVVRGLGG